MSITLVRNAVRSQIKHGVRGCVVAPEQSQAGSLISEPPAPFLTSEKPEAKYPPILDTSRLAKALRKRDEWDEQVKKLKTVEEKLIKINMPRYYGWKCSMLENGEYPVQTLEHFQQITKTQLLIKDVLPDFYLPLAAAAEYHAQQLRPKIEEAIVAEYQGIRRNVTYDHNISKKRQDDKLLSKSFIRQINRIFLNYLSSNVPHLAESHLDIDPRFESFWIVGGLHPPKRIVIKKFNVPWIKDDAEVFYPIDRYYQYISTPVLTLRNKLPLDPILTNTEVQSMEYDVPYNRYAPDTLGIQATYRYGTCIPGFWPGHEYEHGSISYYTRDYLIDAPESHNSQERIEKLHSNGIVSSFGWLNALACYQGFSTYNDVTYPFCTQTVISNGQYWSFYTYQLNTMVMNGRHMDNENVKNICYATNPLKLFDGIDNNGKVVGFNEDILKILLQYYLNPPKEREGVIMKPYLSEQFPYCRNIRSKERAMWLEKTYKHIASNRPKSKLPYEIYDWERIYKIKFQTRPIDARRRPFELNQNPLNKKLDDHLKEYIPKALRVGSLKKQIYRRTFYP